MMIVVGSPISQNWGQSKKKKKKKKKKTQEKTQ